MSARVKAVIDVGTNSIKLLVAEIHAGFIRPILETSRQTRLGKGLYRTRKLQRDAIDRTAEIVAHYKVTAESKHAEQVSVVATSAAREATNTGELIDAIRVSTGLDVQVLTGDEEAQLVYRGVITGLDGEDNQELLIVDVGGGSTELILGRGRVATVHSSFPLGTVRLMEEFALHDPPSQEDHRRCADHIADVLRKHLPASLTAQSGGSKILVGTGGTTTLLARIHKGLESYNRDQIESTVLKRDTLREIVTRLWSVDVDERRGIKGLPGEKADVIVMGSLIYQCIMDEVGGDELRISMRGLRYGVLSST